MRYIPTFFSDYSPIAAPHGSLQGQAWIRMAESHVSGGLVGIGQLKPVMRLAAHHRLVRHGSALSR
ncbi:hypothetical protein [Marivita sp.]|uniref:hypothetical protein n=1 Tax=Marivita sp. TaxID=2003365 RepID=UPI0025B8DE5B|nr:hypothetical protein [Marivita sp.]